MPLFFASNALYPLQMMPPILREFSTFNPLSYVVDAVRGLLITGDLSNIMIDLVAIAIFDVVLFTLASVSFRRIIE
jgi:ABC-2 type transport system permease protein